MQRKHNYAALQGAALSDTPRPSVRPWRASDLVLRDMVLMGN